MLSCEEAAFTQNITICCRLCALLVPPQLKQNKYAECALIAEQDPVNTVTLGDLHCYKIIVITNQQSQHRGFPVFSFFMIIVILFNAILQSLALSNRAYLQMKFIFKDLAEVIC